ncbi:hypothetical protein [Bradyrhizobium sp. sGM-13]|uniref:hypothetical protein n=1 Tax=Bradyrhizobium sp. sGM-13 TaxID=2831781 RepID=UPI001BCC941A|nr:hypothetical protein [Bradyrhizobium sp. sGM-13]
MSDLGTDITYTSGRWSSSFDLEKIEMFKAAHGAERFIEIGLPTSKTDAPS